MKRLTLLALVALSSCSAPRDSNDALQTTVDTVGAVEHVRNAGTPPTWSLERAVVVGAIDAGPAAFGRIRSIVADGDGTIYVADNLANEVRVFGADGSYVRTIGRRGGGPGEFGDLYSLAWLGDELVAMDPRNARLGRFRKDGSWVQGIRHYPITGPGTFIRLHPLGVDGFYAPVVAPSHDRLPFVRMTSTGHADTIAAPERPDGAPTYGVRCDRPDGGIQFISVPEGPTLLFAYPPPGGQMAMAWSGDYRITRTNSAGDTLAVVYREQAPVPYPDSLWQVALEPYETMRKQFPGTRCDPSAPVRPVSRARIRDIVFDESGRMWVEVASGAGFAWEIFSPGGALLGRAVAPARDPSVPVYVRGDNLYQVELGSNGVQYVAHYRLHTS